MKKLAYSTSQKAVVTDIVWYNSTTPITPVTSFEARYMLDYDSDTYSEVKLASVVTVRTIIERTNLESVDMLYCKYIVDDFANIDYVRPMFEVGGSFVIIEMANAYGDITNFTSNGFELTASAGEFVIEFISEIGTARNNIGFEAANTSIWGANDTFKIKNLMLGHTVDVIEPTNDRAITLNTENMKTSRSFDGTDWTSIIGSKQRSLVKWNWNFIDESEKDEFISMKNNLRYFPQIMLYNTTNQNEWVYGTYNSDVLEISQPEACLYNLSVNIKEC
mgnify:CR=1 FL=1|jgi:hypothetical protein